jgi:hypothetical protein
MNLGPLLKVIVETAWYTTWKDHWWFPLCATIVMGLLFWANEASTMEVVIVTVLTALLSPFVFVIGEFLLIRLR